MGLIPQETVTQMTTRQSAQQEAEEAVIISGARKGELIRLSEGELELTPAETAFLDELTQDARRMAESARAAAAEADALLLELRQARAK
jgi:hypothetical protein